MKKRCCPTKKYLSLFKALGDVNRLNIFSYLCSSFHEGESETNVGEVSSCCDVDLSVVSRHLSTLKEAGVLVSEKKGKEVFYAVKAKELAIKLRELADFLDQKNPGGNYE